MKTYVDFPPPPSRTTLPAGASCSIQAPGRGVGWKNLIAVYNELFEEIMLPEPHTLGE